MTPLLGLAGHDHSLDHASGPTLSDRGFAAVLLLALLMVVCVHGAAGAARTKVQGRLVIEPTCDPAVSSGADCVVDSVRPGKFLLVESDEPGDNGIAFKVVLRNLRKDGARVDVADVRVAFLLSVDGGGCSAFFSPSFDLDNGRVRPAVKFGGADTSPPVPASAAGRVEPCGDRVAVIAPGASGDEIIAVDGVLQGPAHPPTNLRGSIVLSPECDPAVTAGADCVADTLRPGKFLIRSSGRRADNGLRFKVVLKRVAKGGERLDGSGVRAVFSLATDGGSCFDFFSPGLELAGGRLKGKLGFGGGDVLPPLVASPASKVELCGHRVRVFVPGENGADLIGVAGLVPGS